MYKISFWCGEKAIGKERPRTVNKNGKTWSYTPKKTAQFESIIRNCFLESSDFFNSPFFTKEFEGKVSISINFYFKIPESYSQSKKFLLNNTAYIKRPDLDNLAKSILDALNGIAYKDDSQIYELHLKKKYSYENGTEVEILYYD